MARYKPIDTSPRFIGADLERQLIFDSFEHILCSDSAGRFMAGALRR